MSRSLEKHSKSKDHISSTCKFVLLGQQNIASTLDSARKIEIENFNAKVRENREIIKRLIDVAIFLCTQELTFRGHDESETSFNRGNFKELISLLNRYDTYMGNFLEKDSDNKPVFSGTSKMIQNELAESISFVINKNISKQIFEAPFFFLAD